MQNGATNTDKDEKLELSELIARVKAIFRGYKDEKGQGGWFQQIEDFKSYIDQTAPSTSKYYDRPPINSPIKLKAAILEFCEKELQAIGWNALNTILIPTGLKFEGRSSLKVQLLQLCEETSFPYLDEVDPTDKYETDFIAENEALKQKLKELEEQRMTELDEQSANNANIVPNTQPHPPMQTTPALFNTPSTINPILDNSFDQPPLLSDTILDTRVAPTGKTQTNDQFYRTDSSSNPILNFCEGVIAKSREARLEQEKEKIEKLIRPTLSRLDQQPSKASYNKKKN